MVQPLYKFATAFDIRYVPRCHMPGMSQEFAFASVAVCVSQDKIMAEINRIP